MSSVLENSKKSFQLASCFTIFTSLWSLVFVQLVYLSILQLIQFFNELNDQAATRNFVLVNKNVAFPPAFYLVFRLISLP